MHGERQIEANASCRQDNCRLNSLGKAISGEAMSDTIYRRIGKRTLDVCCSLIMLVLLSPLLLVIAAAVRFFHGSPVLYQQVRSGYRGRSFVLRKFRTMTNACDDAGQLLSDEQRLTWFGQFLRSTSLDELPELWNVLRGDMSLVGPRPLLPEYLQRYSPEQARRHEVLPGLTGLAQVSGRNAISWEERFAHDVRYVDQLSLFLDLRVLVETVVCVFRRDGISANDHATSPEFMGSHDESNSKHELAA